MTDVGMVSAVVVLMVVVGYVLFSVVMVTGY